ncbi:MAG: hypothetical protein LBK99_04570 [Opitutaceae bacterium]|jgi:autotransporter-associated beta strand protein|nr:hypothetical protein [Opitutaceae bacterium]
MKVSISSIRTGWLRGIAWPLLVFTASPLIAQVTWTGGGGADTNWSTLANWSASPSGQNVLFDNAGSAADASTITGVVDDNYTIGSFRFDYETSSIPADVTYQNLQIAFGKTLTVNGGFSVGSSTESSRTSNTPYENRLTLSGTGSLVVDGGNTSSFTILPTRTGSEQLRFRRGATLDAQNLANFSAVNLNKFVLGADQSGGPTYINSRATLGTTNTIQATTLVLEGYYSKSLLQLGTANTLHVDDILIGHQDPDDPTAAAHTWNAGTGEISFRAAGSTVEIRGKDGVSAANITVGRSGLATATTGTYQGAGEGILDLSKGTTDAKVNNLVIGLADQGTGVVSDASGSHAVRGTVTLGAGTMEAVNVVVGRTTTGNTNTTADITAQATLTIGNGGTLDVAGDLIIGDARQSNIALTSTVNLQSGTLKAASITTGANAAGNKVAAFNWSQNTTLQNHAGSDLTIGAGVDLTLLGSAHTLSIDAGRIGTVDSVISGTGGITTGLFGTVVLNGANTYGGDTAVSRGKLIVNGSIANSAVSLYNSARIHLTDTTFASLSWNSGNAKLEADLSTLTTGLTLNGGAFGKTVEGTFTFDFLNSGEAGQTYTLLSGWNSTSFTAGMFAYENLAERLTGTFAISGNALTLTTAATVPEPAQTATIVLAGSLLAALLLRRRVISNS